jgi:hypothetical protein
MGLLFKTTLCYTAVIYSYYNRYVISIKGRKIKDRLKMKITLTPNFTAMVTAHGKTRSYLHRFKIIQSPVCPCANDNQTVKHIIHDCGKLNKERRKLIADISKDDHWPVGKNVLVNKYLKQITHFINSVDYGNM